MAALVASGPATAASPPPFLYVGGTTCSDTGAGAQTLPFCTIAKAGKVALAGQTVLVASGVYTDEVFPWHSGTAGSPITFQPVPGATAQIVGAKHGFTISNQSWITVSGFTISDSISNAIYVYNATGVTLTNNTVRTSGRRVSGSSAYGMYLNAMTGSVVGGNLVTDNSASGIYLTNAAAGNLITANEVSFNAYGYVRNAVGIDLRAPGNVVEGNRVHDNEDSGIQSYPGGNNNVIVDNVAYHNKGFTTTRLSNCSAPPTGNTTGCITGDHGIDDFAVTGSSIIGNDVYDNVAAGINLEGLTPGTPSGFVFANNIAVDNASSCPDGAGGTVKCPRTRGNIRVDSTSQLGTSLDRDLVALVAPVIAGTTATMMVWGSTSYTSMAAFAAATGQEAHGLQADPLWVGPTAGDFTLGSGSPAIDSADSAAPGQRVLDAAGRTRVDDLSVVDTGVGTRTYDDRGAYEHQPPDTAPGAPAGRATPSALAGFTLGSGPTTVGPSATTSGSPSTTSCSLLRALVSDVDSATRSAARPATLAALRVRSGALARLRVTDDAREQVQNLSDDLAAYRAATIVGSVTRSSDLRPMIGDHLSSLRRMCGR
ncbi:MAG: right-handed parallel beta-helix repeat-containing protein [Actinomycetota bacterium]|nr:right-handed parallel beta-helix repeat-containing protein [Actinomycetota bacterium]